MRRLITTITLLMCLVGASYAQPPRFQFKKNDPKIYTINVDNVTMEIELITPIAIEEGLRFAIREGGRTVGSGKVATIIE